MSEVKTIPADPNVPPPYTPVPIITLPELGAVVLIAAVVIVGAVLKPDQVIPILGFGGTTIAAVLAMTKSQRNGEQTRALRLEVNHRLTELLEARAGEAHARGRDEQRAEDKVSVSEQKAEIKADRQELKAEAKADAAPVEVVNLPPIQKVEVVSLPPDAKKKGGS